MLLPVKAVPPPDIRLLRRLGFEEGTCLNFDGSGGFNAAVPCELDSILAFVVRL